VLARLGLSNEDAWARVWPRRNASCGAYFATSRLTHSTYGEAPTVFGGSGPVVSEAMRAEANLTIDDIMPREAAVLVKESIAFLRRLPLPRLRCVDSLQVVYIEAEVAKLAARGWFGPRMFTRHTEHRRDCVIAKRHHRSLMFPARTRDVHPAVDDDIGGWSHGRTSESSGEVPQAGGWLRKGAFTVPLARSMSTSSWRQSPERRFAAIRANS
jgi:hypothetical protein